MCGKWSARIIALAFINAKVFDVVALEVVHYSSLLLVYELSIAPLHAIAPDNLEKIFLCFFKMTLDKKSPYPIIIIKLEDYLFFGIVDKRKAHPCGWVLLYSSSSSKSNSIGSSG